MNDKAKADDKADVARAHALQERGKLADAAEIYRAVLARSPNHGSALINLGSIEIASFRYVEAEALLKRAVVAAPNSIGSFVNFAVAVSKQGRLNEAVEINRRILERWPDCSPAWVNLAGTLKDQGRAEEAAEVCRRAFERGVFKEAREMSTCLMTLQYEPGVTCASLKAEHERFNGCVKAGVLHAANHDRDPERRLRVGLVSADFGIHPIGFLAGGALLAHDPGQIEFWCYNIVRKGDAVTAALRQKAEHWTDVADPDPKALAKQIAADRIDILFDLSGHSEHNRLLAFALKPAPLQVSWAGYTGTTGLKQMDYVLGDGHHIRPEDEPHYTERVLRMPNGYVTYIPPDYAPPVGPLPAERNGFVTLACFNNLAKVNDTVLELWACILAAAPECRLLLKTRPLRDDATRERILKTFARFGIDPARVTVERDSQPMQLMARYNDVDIALDPFPYSGGLTTLEALWMGVPVVTLTGATFAGRHSTSHLRVAGLPELVTESKPAYLAAVLGLARDRPRLAALRAGMRKRLSRSPLTDHTRFARDFAQVLRGAWREWCAAGGRRL